MERIRNLLLGIACAALLAGAAAAAERAYAPASVWTVTFVRVKPGMDSTYLADLATDWKRVMDEARRQQLIVSYKILQGNASSRDDWNLMLLVESKNWAAFDTADAGFEKIVENMVGPEKKQLETMFKRSDVREIVGNRNLQEIVFR